MRHSDRLNLVPIDTRARRPSALVRVSRKSRRRAALRLRRQTQPDNSPSTKARLGTRRQLGRPERGLPSSQDGSPARDGRRFYADRWATCGPKGNTCALASRNRADTQAFEVTRSPSPYDRAVETGGATRGVIAPRPIGGEVALELNLGTLWGATKAEGGLSAAPPTPPPHLAPPRLMKVEQSGTAGA